MRLFRLFGAATAFSVLAMPALAQAVIYEPGYCAQYYPDAKNHDASAALVGFDLHFHTLAKATLTGLYGR